MPLGCLPFHPSRTRPPRVLRKRRIGAERRTKPLDVAGRRVTGPRPRDAVGRVRRCDERLAASVSSNCTTDENRFPPTCCAPSTLREPSPAPTCPALCAMEATLQEGVTHVKRLRDERESSSTAGSGGTLRVDRHVAQGTGGDTCQPAADVRKAPELEAALVRHIVYAYARCRERHAATTNHSRSSARSFPSLRAPGSRLPFVPRVGLRTLRATE